MLRSRWSIGVRKKDDWEGRAKGVTLTRGSCNAQRWEQQPEVEELKDQEEEGGEPDQANLLMKQAMRFQILKTHKSHAKAAGSEVWQNQEEEDGECHH